MLFRRKDMIETIVRKSENWMVVERNADRFTVSSIDYKRACFIQIRSAERFDSTVFQLFLDTRFSLERTPHLLFGRLMMRSHDLRWASWKAYIGASTEAIVFLGARVPRSALDDKLFNMICEEMRTEAQSFDKELRDKFDYMRGFRPPTGSSGVPMTSQGGADIRFID
jgi:hypothetical protein